MHSRPLLRRRLIDRHLPRRIHLSLLRIGTFRPLLPRLRHERCRHELSADRSSPRTGVSCLVVGCSGAGELQTKAHAFRSESSAGAPEQDEERHAELVPNGAHRVCSHDHIHPFVGAHVLGFGALPAFLPTQLQHMLAGGPSWACVCPSHNTACKQPQ
jgi:hypothetical protein